MGPLPGMIKSISLHTKTLKIKDIIGNEPFSYVGNSKADRLCGKKPKTYIVSNFGESPKIIG